MNEPAPTIGNNQPPLADQLDIELEPLRVRSERLLSSYRAAKITDDESASKVLTLTTLISTFLKKVNQAKKEREAPIKADLAMVQTAFTSIIRPLGEADRECRHMFWNWETKRQAAAAGPLPPIQSDLATLGSLRQINFEITDTKQALTWALKFHQATLVAALKVIIAAALRDKSTGGVDRVSDPEWSGIPGVKAWVYRTPVIR